LFRRMREGSRRPVWAWRRDDPSTAYAHRDVSITAQAEAWWQSGGELGQAGVDRIRYGPEPPSQR
jgi:hypothetical protein